MHYGVTVDKTMILRTYSELCKLPTFEERYEYLKLGGRVGIETFGHDRELNQALYHSEYWRTVVRPAIVSRDGGYDLGVIGCEICGSITIHHMNPITIEDVLNRSPFVYDPEYLITTATNPTHRAIHYADDDAFMLIKPYEERRPYDTCPWKR